MKLLVVDPTPAESRQIVRSLQLVGIIGCIQVHDTRSAVASLSEMKIDVVVTSIADPGFVVQVLNHKVVSRDVRMLALGRAPQDVAPALQVGCTTWLRMPVKDPMDWRDAVKAAVRGQKFS